MKTKKIVNLASKVTCITVKELARRIKSSEFATLKLLATLQYRGKINWSHNGSKVVLSTLAL